MNVLDGLFHWVNFVAPAVVLGFLLTFFGIFFHRSASVHVLLRQALLNAGVSTAVLFAGLIWFGRDGKMATYALMVLSCASFQFFSQKLSGAK